MINTKNYIKNLNEGLNYINLKTVNKIETKILNTIKKKKNIFVCGNGGAASVANHLLCDFNKGIKISSAKKIKPKVISLSSNLEILTAISNDISYEDIFTFQLDNYANRGDVLITFSCSGSSKNILNAIKYSNSRDLFTISFTGFATKKIQEYSKINLNVGIKNYGICEDIFQILMHILSQNIRQRFLSPKKLKNIIL